MAERIGGYSLEQLLGADPVEQPDDSPGLIGRVLRAPFRLVGALIALPFKLAAAVLKAPFRLIGAVFGRRGTADEAATGRA